MCGSRHTFKKKIFVKHQTKGKGMYLNPRTGRTIKKGGATYRALVAQGIRPRKTRSRSRRRSRSRGCRRGEIVRKGYVRKGYRRSDGTRVKRAVVGPVCIPDRGKPGRGPKVLPKLQKGVLGQYGYHDVASMTVGERHEALDRAVRGMTRKEGRGKHAAALKLFRRLNVVVTYNKRTNPRVAGIFRRDRDYVKNKYGL